MRKLSDIFFLLFVYTFAVVVAGEVAEQTCSADGTCTSDSTGTECGDDEEQCAFWAKSGECDENPGYMLKSCKASCGLCEGIEGVAPKVKPKAASSAPDDKEHGNDIGVPQLFESSQFPDEEGKVKARIAEGREHIKKSKLKRDVLEMCTNSHEMCTIWAMAGECESNPKYMKKSCAPACLSCEYLTIEGRCPFDPNAPNTWGEGDLDAMFTKLTSEPYLSKHSVEILSSPATGGPWVITMEDVVSEDEAERLIELGAKEGYEQSSDVGKLNPDGSFDKNINSGRTSTNAWCQHECYKDQMAKDVAYRLSNMTGIEEPNSEYLQLLRYEAGQKYTVHHDYIQHQLTRQQGVRILTMYLYLNDVEAGGGTNFDRLGITVMPKRGRALLWPSVTNDDPHKKDHRTTHQALPVEKGIKYGANAWFHQRDFKTPNADGCH